MLKKKQKKHIYGNLKNGDFTPNFKPCQCFDQILIQIGPLLKKIGMPFICHMTPWWHVYLFWGMSISVPVNSAQTGSNWFLLILQTAKLWTKNNICCCAFQDCWLENLFSLGFNNGCLDEGHTEAAMCVKWWLHKFDLRIMKSVICLGFSNTEEFYLK